MLTDPKEIAIIAGATQKNVRDPQRNREPFEAIFRDFLANVDFDDQRVLDMGPGQFDFGEIARLQGANAIGMDKDPAVLELGRHKGFEVVDGNLKKIEKFFAAQSLDGLFCKYSINAFWFLDDAKREQYTLALDALLVPGGWAWIAPWNGVPKKAELDHAEIDRIASHQIELFEGLGYRTVTFSEAESKTYGVHGATANRVVFVKGLDG